MKKYTLGLLASMLLFACSTQPKKENIFLNSAIKDIHYVLNGETRSWTISPELKPDVLTIECMNDETKLVFETDKDSLQLNVHVGDTIDFYIVLNGKDSAFTRVIGAPKNVNFTAEYIKAHKGVFEVAVPEVHELANILVAISKVGQLDSNMVDMTTNYHKRVIDHFKKFDHEPIMDSINKYIVKPMDDMSYMYYYAYKMNACAYEFNKEGKIINTGVIRKMGFTNPEDPIVANHQLMESFAVKSNFRDFYKANKGYYDSLVQTYKGLNPIDQMQKWLEKKFGFGYGNYTVYFSPLVGGAHSTQRFADNGFDQTIMFVCRADNAQNMSHNLNEMLETRVVFTEIDHNFVNPISDKLLDKINKSLSKREFWADDKTGNGTTMYPNAYAVFNEYMTWSIYSLYCYDRFPKKDVEEFIPKMEKQMVKGRNFIQFDKFNQELIKYSNANKNADVKGLYDHMLVWCLNFQNGSK